ncbi:hypothetical protein GCM10010446_60030 [Streptomyces enissocaesilis]|uniref:Uncharacterized protein n=1 Tax=Streptomyces enissocaesilis TaxID=332589 RepID=A0ABN3XLH8_9ACTN
MASLSHREDGPAVRAGRPPGQIRQTTRHDRLSVRGGPVVQALRRTPSRLPERPDLSGALTAESDTPAHTLAFSRVSVLARFP